MGKLIGITAAILIALTVLANAEDFPSTSGIADLGGGRYLLVDDTKDKPELAQHPRLRVATLTPGGTTIEAVQEDWGDGAKPNDLESIAAIPGQPGSFLIAESNYVGSKYGRMFYVRVANEGSAWTSHVFGTAQLPGWLHGDVEGIALGARADGGLILLISERGGSGPYSPAWLWWGNFDLSTGELTRPEEAIYGMQLSWPGKTSNPWSRACTDLYVDQGGYLWASGAQDNGDNGPFRSVVYRIGRFDATQPYPIMYEMDNDMVWRIDGLKVEALGPAVVEGSILTVFTDDEYFGGLWRPLPPVEPQPDRTPYYGEYGG
jgi:hypothetical protein